MINSFSIASHDKDLCFFASSNTSEGFVNYFDDIFNSLDMLYIIKGGPGTPYHLYVIRKVPFCLY